MTRLDEDIRIAVKAELNPRQTDYPLHGPEGGDNAGAIEQPGSQAAGQFPRRQQGEQYDHQSNEDQLAALLLLFFRPIDPRRRLCTRSPRRQTGAKQGERIKQ